MSDVLYPALQKYYNALSSLERFDKEKDFFDNIASIDSFFSEYRNITFVLQKSIAHTEYKDLYVKNRDKYLSKCKWLVDKRNETTKEHPVQLVKQIEVTAYLPFTGIHVVTRFFSVENDVELTELLEELKGFFESISTVEVFFTATFSFYDKTTNEDVFDRIINGIHCMESFLRAMYHGVSEKTELTQTLINRIEKIKFKSIPREIFLTDDYVFYPQKQVFERADRLELIINNGDNKHLRAPLGSLDRVAPIAEWRDDYFKKFILLNVIIGTTDLMPTFMIVYSDDTFEIKSFNGSLKTTTYRKINEIAHHILIEDIKAVYFMMTYISYPIKDKHLKMTSKERLALENEDILVFMEVEAGLRMREYCFSQEDLDNMNSVANILAKNDAPLNIGCNNLSPIVDAFIFKQQQ